MKAFKVDKRAAFEKSNTINKGETWKSFFTVLDKFVLFINIIIFQELQLKKISDLVTILMESKISV